MGLPVKIDLRDLTAADLDRCRGVRPGYYASPCIIGVMIPDDATRCALDAADVDETDVRSLYDAGLLELPYEQLADAIAMQKAFDGDLGKGIPQDFVEVERIASKYLPQVPA